MCPVGHQGTGPLGVRAKCLSNKSEPGGGGGLHLGPGGHLGGGATRPPVDGAKVRPVSPDWRDHSF